MASLSDLSSELILRILAFVNEARDVVQVRQSNRRLHALASDSLLWKRLFMRAFLLNDHAQLDVIDTRPMKQKRTSHASSNPSSSSSRQLEALPRLKANGDANDDEAMDWYMMYKISHNWHVGSFTSQQLRTTGEQDTEQVSIEEKDAKREQCTDPPNGLTRTIVEVTSTLIFTASRCSADFEPSGDVLVFPISMAQTGSRNGTHHLQQEALASLSRRRRNGTCHVSALAVDRSSVWHAKQQVRLLVAYSDGLLRTLTYDERSAQFTEEFSHLPAGSNDKVALMSFHWPFIVTCTEDFKIRILRIDPITKQKVHVIAERRSYSCHWPACLRLDRNTQTSDSLSFHLSIAYTHAVYPRGWAVSLQNITFNESGITDSRSASAKHILLGGSRVASGITSTDKGKAKATSMLTHQGRSERHGGVERLTSLTYEHPFIVVGSRDNSAFCFRVRQRQDDGDVTGWPAKTAIEHVRTLYGHTGTVYSVSLNGGRCVTGGSDGSVRVWRLGDEETSLANAAGLGGALSSELKRGIGRVVTLKLPCHDVGSLASEVEQRKRGAKRKRDDEEATSLSLSDILRGNLVTASSSPLNQFLPHPSKAVRWVASAFDRIVSVSTCGLEATQDISSSTTKSVEQELVQLWSFS